VRVLGISAYGHDSAAAMVVDGRLVAAVEEERFTLTKHEGGFPTRAARWCLRQAGGADALAFYHVPLLHGSARLVHVARRLPGSIRFLTERQQHVGGWLRMIALCGGGLARRTGLPGSTPLHFVEHHRAHAFDAVAGAPAGPLAVLSIDGMGEWTTTWTGVFRNGRLRRLDEIAFPHSLGIFWQAVTQHLGFEVHADEYKVMGMAAIGERSAAGALREAVVTLPEGRFRLDERWFRHQYGAGRCGSPLFERHFGPPRRPDQPLEERHFALAAAAQQRLEEVVLHIAEHLHRRSGTSTLCLTGGVALNSAMNAAVVRRGPFARVHVPAAPNDAGTASGAALALARESRRSARDAGPPPFLGPKLPDDLCGSAPPGELERVADPTAVAVELLTRGAVIGWAQGRMEFGPRALGNRSILADPRRRATRERINRCIKGREWFRPLAPAILAELSHEILAVQADCARMSFALPVRSHWRARLEAVVHEDGSARAQAVRAEEQPLFHRLIDRFRQHTGVPALLNTSLNVAGQPIARSAADLLRVFEEGGLDALFVGDTLLRRAAWRDSMPFAAESGALR